MKKCECLRIIPGCHTAVLMIHGIMGKPSYFAPFLPLVPEGMSVCNVLLPGHFAIDGRDLLAVQQDFAQLLEQYQ